MTDLRRLQLAELEILKDTIRICNENNLTYYMLGGTLLGAVRHKGFIPWDDDIDIGLIRADYEKFLGIAPKQLKKGLCLQTYQGTEEYLHYPAKVVDEQIKLLSNMTGHEQVIPAWVDIFPLDGMPNNYIQSKLHQFRLLAERAIFKFSCFDEVVSINTRNRPFVERALIWIGKHTKIGRGVDSKKQLDRIDRDLKRYSTGTSTYYINFMGAYKTKEMFPKSYYGDGKLYDFEDISIVGPINADAVLKQMYGDYMKYPPESERNKHLTEVVFRFM